VSLAFENVSFSYRQDGDVPVKVLNEVSFKVQSGQTTAIIGPSGAGKSTLFNLALRFYDPDDGLVTLNGTDVKTVTLESLRAHMALVSQDIVIFDDSVAANIAYGLDGASQEQIEQAAKAANAHNFIMALEDGYETRLGENGQSLSGGQKQRIAIARAILRDAPILLLDEATSALDNESEALIQYSLEKIARGKTVLVIAHRLSTIQNADHILVLDQGEIVEEGTHADLIQKKGLYAALHKKSGK
jgi:ATP-binding cassette subfamily B protein